MEKPAVIKNAVITPILQRWSPRAFKLEKVASNKIYSCLEAARWAASAFNEQPWHIILGNYFGDKQEQNTWHNIISILVPFNQDWAQNAPILMLMIAKNHYSHNNQPNMHAWYDCGQAMAHIALQATHEGLYSHQMSGFDNNKATTKFGIPNNYSPVSIIAIGNISNASFLPETLREKEIAPRFRKDFNQWVCSGTFANILAEQ